MPIFIRVKATATRSHLLALGDRIDRRIDIHSAGLSLPCSKGLFRLLAHRFDEVTEDRVVGVLWGTDIEIDSGCPGTIVLVISDVTFFVHAIEHNVPPVERSLLIAGWRIEARGLGKSSQQCALFKRQVL